VSSYGAGTGVVARFRINSYSAAQPLVETKISCEIIKVICYQRTGRQRHVNVYIFWLYVAFETTSIHSAQPADDSSQQQAEYSAEPLLVVSLLYFLSRSLFSSNTSTILFF
jgi:hypothetical protein